MEGREPVYRQLQQLATSDACVADGGTATVLRGDPCRATVSAMDKILHCVPQLPWNGSWLPSKDARLTGVGVSV